MYLGGIRYQVDAKRQVEKRPFAHLMIPRFTGTRFHLDEGRNSPAVTQYYDQITQGEPRNHLIFEDVLRCAEEGRNGLLLSERARHVKLLGGQTNAQMKSRLLALKESAAPVVVCSTGKFIGEGFDDSRLDTFFLTMPISWRMDS